MRRVVRIFWQIALAILFVAGSSACTPCRNTPVQIVDSPIGTLRAVAFERSCGNQERPGLQVSLFDPKEPPSPQAPGNIFASLTAGYIDLRWNSAGELLVVSDAPVPQIVKQQPSFSGIRIHYRYPTNDELNAESEWMSSAQ